MVKRNPQVTQAPKAGETFTQLEVIPARSLEGENGKCDIVVRTVGQDNKPTPISTEGITDCPPKSTPTPDNAPKSDTPKSDGPKSDTPKSDTPKSDTPKSDTPIASAPPLSVSPEITAVPSSGPAGTGNSQISATVNSTETVFTNSGSKGDSSGGKIAGAVVGGLVGGALIACLVCFLLYRRRNRGRSTTFIPSHLPYDAESKAGAIVTAAAIPAGSDIDSLLPQPVEDEAITRELSKIRDNIKNHVQTFYHFQPVNSDIDRVSMAGLAAATNMNASTLAGILYDSNTRADAVRLFIAWSVLSRCEGGDPKSLLPEGVAPLQDAIPEKGGSDPAKSALFSKWKVLTGTLLEPQYGGRAPATAVHTEAGSSIIAEMDLVLSQLIKSGVDGEKRRRNLEMIVSRASKLAFLLFSQPGSFYFDFSGGQRSRLVVFPGLLQVVGDQGQTLSPPKVLLPTEFADGA